MRIAGLPRLPVEVGSPILHQPTSALGASETSISPMHGKVNRLRLDIPSWPYLGLRQPACFCCTTRSAASAKLGMPCIRRFSASGSPALAGQLAVRPRFLSGLEQRDAAESELTLATTDDEVLDPAPGFR